MDNIPEFINLMERFRKIRIFEIPEMNIDITISQMRMVGFVNNHGPCRTQKIADGLGLSAPTVSVAVNKLVRSGWLEKKADPEDGRATLISSTEKSLGIMKQMRRKQLQGINHVLSSLNDKEQRSLLELLNRIVTSFEEMGK